MYKKISFLIFGFWFTAIAVGLIIGMYEIHNSSQKNTKQSIELHKNNKKTITELKSAHALLKSKVDNLQNSFSGSTKN